MSAGRVPPHSLEAERAVVSALLLDPARVLQESSAGALDPGDFYQPALGELVRAAKQLHQRGEAVDVVTLEAHLRTGGKLKGVGGASGLAELAAASPTAANVDHHAAIVRDRAALRRLIRVAAEVQAEAYAAERPDDLVRRAEEQIRSCYTVDEAGRSLQDVLRGIYDACRPDSATTTTRGVPTGLTDLDEALTYRGVPTGLVTTIGAPTNTGKSALANAIAMNAALRGEAVVYATFEDRAESPAGRALAALSGIPNDEIQRAEIDAGYWRRFEHAVGQLWQARVHYIEQVPRSAGALVTQCQRSVKRLGASLLVLDYLQLLRSGQRLWNRQEEVDTVFSAILDLALSLPNTATVLVSQLRRTGDERPTRETLYHSGKLEQGSHTILLLWAPKKAAEHPCRLCIVEKQKDGEPRDVVLGWDGPHVRFHDANSMVADEYIRALTKSERRTSSTRNRWGR